jgi:hypothetical protein
MPRAVGGTGQSRKPFLESPADFFTRAPNLIRLGQGRRARQDLVRNSESTTKCGDCGDDSRGECASIGDSWGIRKSAAHSSCLFRWITGAPSELSRKIVRAVSTRSIRR